MSTWTSLAEHANTALSSVFGETVSYSRPAGPTLDAVAAFEISAIPRTDAEFTGRDAPTHALEVVVADISLGPQRGDLVVWAEVTYQVHTVEPPTAPYENGTALIGVRRLKA